MSPAMASENRRQGLAGKSLIRSVELRNILSYGPTTEPLELGPLNVLIGPNASGKSNLLHSLSLLREAPNDIGQYVLKTGGIEEWLWKGFERSGPAEIEIVINRNPINPRSNTMIKYRLSFGEHFLGDEVYIVDEGVWYAPTEPTESPWRSVYAYNRGRPLVAARMRGQPYEEREDVNLETSDFSIGKSILAQLLDAYSYPEIFAVRNALSGIRTYGKFNVGPLSPLRLPQPAVDSHRHLDEDGSNLSLVLNALEKQPPILKDVKRRLQEFSPKILDIRTEISGGTIQTVFHEEGLGRSVPSIRMSDGSLHYLCLLATLCHPNPPPLICIEEPEEGLHPDIIPEVAKLLQEASQRTQLIVTTHSDILVDALSNTPETIIVTERGENGTVFQRLDKNELKVWLEKYSLGELWTSGHIGGNRW